MLQNRHVEPAAVGAAVAVLLWASGAEAATVSVRVNPNRGLPPANTELVYRAAPGESNRTVVQPAQAMTPWTVSDPGAVIQAGEGCTAMDAHRASCAAPQPAVFNPLFGLGSADVELGDLDDEVRLLQLDGGGNFELFADGGAGNDTLYGLRGELRGGPGDDKLYSTGFAVRAVLDGGGGRDEMRGGFGFETFVDGDLDGAIGEGAPGPDVIDGGRGSDTISYKRRTASVFVDLTASASAGARGERDIVRNVESIVGGRGDDRLAGDSGRNEIDGQGGRDTLIGRGGDDSFRNGHGSISCGEGLFDLVLGPRSADYLKPGCETVAEPEGSGFPAYPTRIGARAVRYRVHCPTSEEEGLRTRCSATVTITEATRRHRRLGSATSPSGRWEDRRLDVPLTGLGQRLASAQGGVLARMTLTISGRRPDARQALRWTIRLKVPR